MMSSKQVIQDEGAYSLVGPPNQKKRKNDVSLQDTPFTSIIDNDQVLSRTLECYQLCEYSNGVALMNSLSIASVEELTNDGHSQSIKVISFKEQYLLGLTSLFPGKIFVRSFYDELIKLLEQRDKTILTGNPGTSKSWFQMYILYKIFTGSCFKNIEVVVRHVSTKMVYYFVKDLKSYIGPASSSIIVHLSKGSILYLYEPDSCPQGPMYEFFDGNKIIVTCSPDASRYKEFRKHHHVPFFYMPVWSLIELQLIGEHLRPILCDRIDIDYSKGAIEERYVRFGEIFSYVLPEEKEFYQQKLLDQESAMYLFTHFA